MEHKITDEEAEQIYLFIETWFLGTVKKFEQEDKTLYSLIIEIFNRYLNLIYSGEVDDI